MKRGSLVAAVLATVLAFVARAWNVASIQQSPFARTLIGDSLRYDTWARELAAGNWLGTEVFYQAPLYPYWLGSAYAFLGDEIVTVRLLQATVGALASGLLALAAARFFRSPWVGLIAGCLLALYPPVIFHDVLIQKSVLDTFLLCLLLFGLSRNIEQPRWGIDCAIGITLALMILTRENTAVFALPIALWIFVGPTRGFPKKFGRAAAFATGAALILSPVALRNLAVGGELHLTSSQLGHNLYLGNNPEANGTYQPIVWGHGDSEWHDAKAIAERKRGRPLGPSEVSDYWTDQVVAYIGSDPVDWLELVNRKFLLTWNATEIIDSEDQYTHARFSPILAWSQPLLHFGILGPLALLGAIATFGQRRRLWILYAMIGTYAATLLVFFVLARYRLPLVPLLLPFVAAALILGPAWLYERFKTAPATACITIAAVMLFAWFANGPRIDRAGMEATTYYNLGIGLRKAGRTDESIDQFRKALTIVPGYTEATFAMANALAQQGQTGEAILLFEQAANQQPNIGAIRADQGRSLSRVGDLGGALKAFNRALELDPNLDDALYFRSLVNLRLGRIEDARRDMQEAIEKNPGLRIRLRHAAWLQAAAPEKSSRIDSRRALQMARWAVNMGGGDDPLALSTLSAALATAERFDLALAPAQEAVRLAEARGDLQLVAVLTIRLNQLGAGRRIVRRPSDPIPKTTAPRRS